MGLLDSLVQAAMKGTMSASETQALPNVLSQILSRTDLGSIGGLLKQLQGGGLDRQVASWLGNGSNMPASPDQLRSALGDDHLQQIGQSAGIPLDQLIKMLAQGLPGAIDHMSPNGTLQEDPASHSAAGGSLADQAGLQDVGRRR
jgi:uncharacterized protein YidB (DUF937 family)